MLIGGIYEMLGFIYDEFIISEGSDDEDYEDYD